MRKIKETNPAKDLRRAKLEALERCYNELESYKIAKLKLQYTTFFIPGWTGENCAAWKDPYDKIPEKYKAYYKPAKYWIGEIIENKDDAHFVNLQEESKKSNSFIELGKQLKNRLFDLVKDSPINLVGHSMGGLDIRAAVIDTDSPKLNVKNVLTVGTPNNGTGEAGLFGIGTLRKIIMQLKKFEPYHIAQGRSMFSKGKAIEFINSLDSRLRLLSNIDNFYVLMGLRDSVVKGSPKLDLSNVVRNMSEKVKVIQTSSAEHSRGHGITQDPRLFLPTVKILCGIELEDNFNYGYINKKG